MRNLLTIATFLSLPLSALANQAIENKLNQLGVNIKTIEESPLKGIKTVTTEQGVMLASEDGNFLFTGELYDLSGETPVNYMIAKLKGEVDKLSDEMIVYPAKNEKFSITVFTDITCGYCQKLHEQINEYNDLGITVKYLAFPRQGPTSENADNMQSVWCMAERNKAFDLATSGELPAKATCDIDIKTHYNLGNQMGVTGTPAIITPNGNLVPGYLPPQDMLSMLQNQ
ncbi:bifunctional protein-disulfide isomerase/oxidoreductase DsbC [Thorsellia kenyensis]|uniref:Thiol:disulfide interchange protein n=1 Tax=Thorsellia kenyensis TaxID=1549888 RepID=A0ABV6CAR6_9GAMM